MENNQFNNFNQQGGPMPQQPMNQGYPQQQPMNQGYPQQPMNQGPMQQPQPRVKQSHEDELKVKQEKESILTAVAQKVQLDSVALKTPLLMAVLGICAAITLMFTTFNTGTLANSIVFISLMLIITMLTFTLKSKASRGIVVTAALAGSLFEITAGLKSLVTSFGLGAISGKLLTYMILTALGTIIFGVALLLLAIFANKYMTNEEEYVFHNKKQSWFNTVLMVVGGTSGLGTLLVLIAAIVSLTSMPTSVGVLITSNIMTMLVAIAATLGIVALVFMVARKRLAVYLGVSALGTVALAEIVVIITSITATHSITSAFGGGGTNTASSIVTMIIEIALVSLVITSIFMTLKLTKAATEAAPVKQVQQPVGPMPQQPQNNFQNPNNQF